MKPFQVTNVQTLCDDSLGFLQLKKATYINKDGAEANWSYCERPKKGTSQTDVVTLACHTQDGRFAVIRQPRVPLNDGQQTKFEWSFPAGLTEGDTIQSTAIKELKEETGYGIARELGRSPPLPKTAGLTNETNTLVECELGLEGEQELEPSEMIDVHLLTPQEIVAMGKDLDPTKEVISNGLWAYMKGFTSGKKL